ncbi:DUF883 family protein [Nitratireductor alexandrii]|uniref:DUF883 family protein n=1 Tax=Nitratireductor alexandrii TaxID=2448161 RepID=UPI000FDC34A7|nr:DUF883 family protein [Nitratireductor alexandrii]
MAQSRSAASRTGNGSAPPSAEQLEEQIAQLKSDISELAKTIGALGAHTAGTAKSRVARTGDAVAALPHEAVNMLRTDIELLERKLKAGVKRSPWRALGLAAGAGFLLALAARRP